MQPIKHKKTNLRPNRAVWTVFVNCAHWRGSTLAIYKTVLIIFPLCFQPTTMRCYTNLYWLTDWLNQQMVRPRVQQNAWISFSTKNFLQGILTDESFNSERLNLNVHQQAAVRFNQSGSKCHRRLVLRQADYTCHYAVNQTKTTQQRHK